MTYCSECNAIEQGFTPDENDDAKEAFTCDCCGAEDSMSHFDEDYGQDR
jgi:hypothetical protein